MSFLDKVGGMFSKVADNVGNFIKPIKHNVQQGLAKAGNWLDRNHETIGTIATGIGNILSNLPAGAASDKLRQAGNTISDVGQGISSRNYLTGISGAINGAFQRPSNIARTPPNKLSEANRPANQNPAINPVNSPIQQPPVAGANNRLSEANDGNRIIRQSGNVRRRGRR